MGENIDDFVIMKEKMNAVFNFLYVVLLGLYYVKRKMLF